MAWSLKFSGFFAGGLFLPIFFNFLKPDSKMLSTNVCNWARVAPIFWDVGDFLVMGIIRKLGF